MGVQKNMGLNRTAGGGTGSYVAHALHGYDVTAKFKWQNKGSQNRRYICEGNKWKERHLHDSSFSARCLEIALLFTAVKLYFPISFFKLKLRRCSCDFIFV